MADEITVNLSLKAAKGNINIERRVSAYKADMAGDSYGISVASIATTAGGTALTLPAAVGTAGWAFFKNLDAANYVEVGVAAAGTFYPLVKLLAGESAVLPLATTAVYARANTAAALLEHFVIER